MARARERAVLSRDLDVLHPHLQLVRLPAVHPAPARLFARAVRRLSPSAALGVARRHGRDAAARMEDHARADCRLGVRRRDGCRRPADSLQTGVAGRGERLARPVARVRVPGSADLAGRVRPSRGASRSRIRAGRHGPHHHQRGARRPRCVGAQRRHRTTAIRRTRRIHHDHGSAGVRRRRVACGARRHLHDGGRSGGASPRSAPAAACGPVERSTGCWSPWSASSQSRS